MEHGRDHVGVRDAVLFDESQRLGGVPVLHDHDGHPVEQRQGDREDQRRGVVQRSGAQVGVDAVGDVLVVAAEVDRGQCARGAPVDRCTPLGRPVVPDV